jgi:hypothetical protein
VQSSWHLVEGCGSGGICMLCTSLISPGRGDAQGWLVMTGEGKSTGRKVDGESNETPAMGQGTGGRPGKGGGVVVQGGGRGRAPGGDT